MAEKELSATMKRKKLTALLLTFGLLLFFGGASYAAKGAFCRVLSVARL